MDCGLLLAALLLAGCGDSAPPPPPDPKAAAVEAAGVVGEAAAEAAQNAQAGNYVEAWAGYAGLAQQPQLTDEQRAAAQRAAGALLPSLHKAAEEGDARAKELLEHYRASK